jgi:hypothetical protein
VAARIYQGQPFSFLQTQKQYLINNVVKGTDMCVSPNKVINDLFYRKCEGNELRLTHYYKFLITVQAQHKQPKGTNAVSASQISININAELLAKAVLSEIANSDSTTLEESVIIQALKNKKLKHEEELLEKLIQALELKTRAFPRLRIYLVEKRGDYVESFRLNMASAQLRPLIFEWINRTLNRLAEKEPGSKELEDLKGALQKSIRELIAINDSECVAVMDKWFEDSYQE